MSGEQDTVEPRKNTPGEGDAAEQQANPGDTLESGGETLENEADQLLDDIEEDAESAKDLAGQLEAATRQAQENWDKLLRTQAEMENMRRRTEKELQNAHRFGLEKFVKELLPVMDSLELGIEAASADAPEVVKLREGSELTLKQFQAVFERFNIVAVDPLGEAFNPEQHQAMAMQPDSEAAPNTVIKVFQKGYLLNDRLLRPAMVIVAQPAPPASIDEQA